MLDKKFLSERDNLHKIYYARDSQTRVGFDYAIS